MAQHLVIVGLGEDRPGLVNEVSKLVLDHRCNIEESRMARLGGQFAVLVLVSGNWNTVTKLAQALPELEQRLGVRLCSHTTESGTLEGQYLPYSVDVIGLDQPGIVHQLSGFFSGRQINIQELATRRYAAAHTATPMFSVHMTVQIPAELHLATLRDEFMDFCDGLNLDAVIEPLKE